MANKRRPHGDGTLYQLKNGKWVRVIRFTNPDTGERLKRSFTRATRKEATEAAQAFLVETSGRTAKTRGTVAECVDQYLDGLAVEVKTDATRASSLRAYRARAKRLAEDPIAKMPLASVRVAHVEDMAKRMQTGQGQPCSSPSYVRRIQELLRSAMERKVRLGQLPANAAASAAKVKVPKTKIVLPTDEEFGAIMDQAREAGPRMYAIVMVLFGAWTRRGELLGLKWSNLDWDNHLVEVRRQIVESDGEVAVKTVKSERTLELPESVFEALRAWQAVQDPASEWIFTTSTGHVIHPTELTALCRELGFNPHKARHFGATRTLEQDPNQVYAVAKYLGHSDIKTTISYYVHDKTPAKLSNSVLNRLNKEALATIDRSIDRLAETK